MYVYVSGVFICVCLCVCLCASVYVFICVCMCVSVYMLMLLEGIEIRRQCCRFGSFFPPMCVLWGSTCQAG